MIYEPRGRAKEYADLACNLAVGCEHRCLYCYGPDSMRVPKEDWPSIRFKDDAVERFRQSARRYAGDPRMVLFSFATDPCATPEAVSLLKKVLPICEEHRLKVAVLTKNPQATRSMWPMFARQGWHLGTTICFLDERDREWWEPGAPTIESRRRAIMDARALGIFTFVSIEPVLHIDHGIEVIKAVRDEFDLVKVGKWNHDPRANGMDWTRLLREARVLLEGREHLFKKDLLVAAGEGGQP